MAMCQAWASRRPFQLRRMASLFSASSLTRNWMLIHSIPLVVGKHGAPVSHPLFLVIITSHVSFAVIGAFLVQFAAMGMVCCPWRIYTTAILTSNVHGHFPVELFWCLSGVLCHKLAAEFVFFRHHLDWHLPTAVGTCAWTRRR